VDRTANWCSHGGWFTLADYDTMLALEFGLQLALALGFRVVFQDHTFSQSMGTYTRPF